MPLSEPNTGYVKADENATEGALDKFSTSLGDLFTVERRTQIDISSNYSLSAERNETTTTGSATITSTKTDAEIDLSTTATADDSAILESAELGRYVSGYASESGMGVRIPSRPASGQEYRWGYYNDANGFFFGEDDSGIFVGLKTSESGDPIKVYQDNWNADTLDGDDDAENPSGLTLDLSDGHIFRIEFTWYGYGEIAFIVLMRTEDNRQIPVTIHRESPLGRTSVQEPNLPIRAEVDNGSTAESMQMFVGGRQFAVYGDEGTSSRTKTARRLSYSLSGTTWVPVAAIRRQNSRDATKVNFFGIDIAASDNVLIEVREDATISDGTFSVPSDIEGSETAVEANTDLTTADRTTGRKQNEFLVGGGSGNVNRVTAEPFEDIRFTRQTPLVVFARKVSGNGGTLSAVLRWREEW